MLSATIPLAVFHAVRRHHVIDIRLAVSRGTTTILTSILIAAALATIAVAIEEHLHDSLASQILVYVLVVIVLKLLFEWLHEKLNHACDRVLFRRLHAAQQSLRRIANELPVSDSFDAIDRQLITEPAGCLDLASAAVFRREPMGNFRQRIDPIGWSGGRDSDLPLNESALKELARRGEAMRLKESDAYDPSQARTADPVIAMPVVAAEGLVAVVLYGAHQGATTSQTTNTRSCRPWRRPRGTPTIEWSPWHCNGKSRSCRKDFRRCPTAAAMSSS